MSDLRPFMTIGDEVVAVVDFPANQKIAITKKGMLIQLERTMPNGPVEAEVVEVVGTP